MSGRRKSRYAPGGDREGLSKQKLDPAVARGEKPDTKGKYRTPMPKHIFEKLKGMGVIGGGSNDDVVDPRFEPDLVNITNKRPGSDGEYSQGGFVRARRKNSFKGVF